MAINVDDMKFLLSHFEPPAFPRRISTQLSKNRQFAVYSLEEMLCKFEESYFIDCKVNAYNYIGHNNSVSAVADAVASNGNGDGNGNGNSNRKSFCSRHGIPSTLGEAVKLIQQRAISEPMPTVIFIDLDQKKYLDKTRRKIKDTFVDEELEPTVISSGNGYHIVLPIETDPAKYYCPRPDWDKDRLVPGRSDLLANIIARDYKYGIPANLSPANMFIRFAEQFLTSGKADADHNPSVRSCMVRVPGSYNSKSIQKGVDPEVTIVNRWNGRSKAHILFLINRFYYHVKETHEKRQRMMLKARKKRLHLEANRRFTGVFEIDTPTGAPCSAIGDCSSSSSSSIMLDPKMTEERIMEIAHKTHWYIKLLFQIAIDDFRKRAVRLLFAPYMITVKRMDSEVAASLISNWLERCDKVRPLDFDGIDLTQQAIDYTKDRMYSPLGELKFKDQVPELFAKLERMSNKGEGEGGN